MNAKPRVSKNEIKKAMNAHPRVSLIKIRVKKFRPFGGVSTTTVDMDLMGPDGNALDEKNGITSDGIITKKGTYNFHSRRWNSLTQKVEPLQLKFWVVDDSDVRKKEKKKDPDMYQYLIHGIAFSNRDQSKSNEKLGQHMFTEVKIANEKIGGKDVRVLTVTNDGPLEEGKRESYDYMILIQRLSDGAFGIIDPEIENEH